MAKKVLTDVPAAVPQLSLDAAAFADAITKAMTQATEAANGPRKKTISTRKSATPWTPEDGSKKAKLRKAYSHHGQLFNEATLNNDEILAINRIKRPGKYLDNWVEVKVRKDRGLDIDYPIKTAAQRLRLMNDFGITSIIQLANRLADEGEKPKVDIYADE